MLFSYTSPHNHKLRLCPYFISDYNSIYSNWRPCLLYTVSPPHYISFPLLFLSPFSLEPFPSALLTSCCHYQFPPVSASVFKYVGYTFYTGVCIHTGVFVCVSNWMSPLSSLLPVSCSCRSFCLLQPIRSLLPSFQLFSFIIPSLFSLPVCSLALSLPSPLFRFIFSSALLFCCR